MADDPREAQKRAAAGAAATGIEGGMLVGLGTGTTAAYLIEAVARRVRQGLTIRTVASSIATADKAARLGLAPLDMGDIAAVDLYIDGVDAIDPAFRAIKGGGGAMLREKIVAASAARFVAIADETKAVPTIGGQSVPLEILPFARASVEARIARLGGTLAWRNGQSDQDNLLADAVFPKSFALPDLAAALCVIPGLLGHGLFLSEIDALILGTIAGVVKSERNASVTKD
jgi:ribose 5-phosphate isomerase A